MAVVPGVSAAATAVLCRATSTALGAVVGRVAKQSARPRRPWPAGICCPLTTGTARAFSAKARQATGPGRKAQLLARFAQLGTTFDVHGPVDELYHPHEAATTRGLFEQPGEFLSAAADQHECEALNPDGVPEIAFVGRSNVGKSSLLNALMRTTAVNTSKSPGRTKGLNFFGVGHGSLRLVDLPGYGYARASKDTVRELHRRIYEYLFTRDRHVLMHVFVLVDVRRGQPSAADLELMRGMDREGTRYRVVLTKMDTVTSEDDLKQTIVNTTHLTRNNLACDPVVSVVSAKLGVGVDELRHSIGQLVAERQGLADFVPAAPFIEDPAGEFGGHEFATGGWGKER